MIIGEHAVIMLLNQKMFRIGRTVYDQQGMRNVQDCVLTEMGDMTGYYFEWQDFEGKPYGGSFLTKDMQAVELIGDTLHLKELDGGKVEFKFLKSLDAEYILIEKNYWEEGKG